jgi:hypothetical protein
LFKADPWSQNPGAMPEIEAVADGAIPEIAHVKNPLLSAAKRCIRPPFYRCFVT